MDERTGLDHISRDWDTCQRTDKLRLISLSQVGALCRILSPVRADEHTVTDPNIRIPNPRITAPAPRTSEEFARAFRVSRQGKENGEDMMAYWHEFVGRGDLQRLYAASAQAEHSRWAPERSPYTTSLFSQLKVVSLRRVANVSRGDRGIHYSGHVRILISDMCSASDVCFAVLRLFKPSSSARCSSRLQTTRRPSFRVEG